MSNYFVYEGRLPSMNELIAANRKHAQAGAKLKRDWQEGVCWQISFALNRGTLKAVSKPCIVHFEYREKTQKRDLDNVAGFAHKIILDSLVQMKILQNDTQRYVRGFTDRFYKADKDEIIVEIEELDEV